jgi:excisionase family DNA binding protein
VNGQTLHATGFEPLLTADEAAELLHLHVNTLRLWARQQKVPHHRLGRRLVFRASALNRLFPEPYTDNAVLTASTERKAA